MPIVFSNLPNAQYQVTAQTPTRGVSEFSNVVTVNIASPIPTISASADSVTVETVYETGTKLKLYNNSGILVDTKTV